VTNVCRICGSTDLAEPICLRETMFGTGETFLYHQCNDCRCLQIVERPADMDRYYPATYYSYNIAQRNIRNLIRSFLAYYGPGWLFAGRDWWENPDRKSLRDAHITRSSRILDLGCGSGNFTASLKDIGLRNVIGADPFIPEDTVHPNGVKILRKEASEIEGEFDLVMMQASMEHIWDQHGIVREMARLLAPGGHCMMNIPTLDSWAWEHYGENWVHLDPPRHFYIHSRAGITRLLASAGLEVTSIVDSAASFGILASEKIRMGLPQIDPATGHYEYERHLPGDVIASASAKARQLNREKRGDVISVHARRISARQSIQVAA
jgi:2-polyprenyl-3-methyl-5-hydroxy-6-metoxy-1,4-benzoquinol methylase